MPRPHPRFRRRIGLPLAAVAVVAGTAAPIAVSSPGYAASGLAAAAAASGRFFGTATDQSELSDSAYKAILIGGEFNQLTPGNQLKWQYTEPNQGQFNFTEGDNEVDLGRQNGMKVRGHTLVWHSQLAGWVDSLPAGQVQAAMENHITQEVSHFKGKVFAWDVVNEPFNEDGTYRSDAFYNAMGSGYVAATLKAARAADPNVKLYLNDYNIEGLGSKSDAMYSLASSLKAQGVPLDGIGFQTHLDVQYGFPTNMQQNLQRFADLGLDVGITELDVRMPLPEDSSKDATQVTYYTNVVKACVAVSRCVGVTIWDYTDKYSWVPSVFSGEGAALPWDSNLNKKTTLYNAILSALGGTPGTSTTTRTTTTRPVTSTTSSTSTTTRSTTRTTTPGTASGCSVTDTVSAWNNGLVSNITIRNTGSTTVNGWSLAFSLPSGQTITSGWNAAFSPSTGSVTAKDAGWNATLAPSASTNIGFQATHTGNSAKPASFSLNGVACSVG